MKLYSFERSLHQQAGQNSTDVKPRGVCESTLAVAAHKGTMDRGRRERSMHIYNISMRIIQDALRYHYNDLIQLSIYGIGRKIW